MKKLYLIILILPLLVFSQTYSDYNQIKNGVNLGNDISTLFVNSGFTFVYKDSLQYEKTFREIIKIEDGLIYICKRRYSGCDMSCAELEFLTIIELMKSFSIIDDSSFLFPSNVRAYQFDQYFKDQPHIGWAKKNGKFALISKNGNLLSDFKYEDESCSFYTEVGVNKVKRTVYVINDKNGKEVFKSTRKPKRRQN